MKILWHSNAPWTPSGYGQQTRIFTPRIRDLGHGVSVSAFFGLEGAVIDVDGIKTYPKKYEQYGNDVILAHAGNCKADVIMTLMDVQVLMSEKWPPLTRWIPWYPIDHDTMPQVIRNKVSQAYKRIVFSRHAERLTHETGLDCYYVPHGVETDIFKPGDKAVAREKLGLPKDAWIVGTVAMNKGVPSRKQFVEMLHAFANCKKRHSDMVYFLQTSHGAGVGGMINLPEVIGNLGLEQGKDVFFCNQYSQEIGFPPEYMPMVYQALDAHMLVSMGEGFGVPILEAQACGCPVIVGDWTAMPELCFSGRKVPKDDAEAIYTPMAAYQYAPHVRGIELAIEAEYKHPSPSDRAVRMAQDYDANTVASMYWQPVLMDIEEAVNDNQIS